MISILRKLYILDFYFQKNSKYTQVSPLLIVSSPESVSSKTRAGGSLSLCDYFITSSYVIYSGCGYEITFWSRIICSYNRYKCAVDMRTVFQKMVLITGMFL